MNEEIETLLRTQGFEPAAVSRRFYAYLIDYFLLVLLFIVALQDVILSTNSFREFIEASNLYVLEFLAITFLYQAIFTGLYGATVGKLIMKIRVVPIHGESLRPSWGESMTRSAIRILSEAIFYLGFLWALMEPVGRSWHDIAARTIVVDA